MAQWRGQFTGLTHETKIEDQVESLRVAANSFLAAIDGPTRDEKAKVVRKIAARLLSTRLKFLKARIAATSPVTDKPGRHHLRLIEWQSLVRANGINAILAEFGVSDASKENSSLS